MRCWASVRAAPTTTAPAAPSLPLVLTLLCVPGLDNLVEVPADERGVMRTDLLAEAVEAEVAAGNQVHYCAPMPLCLRACLCLLLPVPPAYNYIRISAVSSLRSSRPC